jgi:rhodanese-related sulfurtransferase
VEIDIDALASRAGEALVLDVREPEEYTHGHVPGAINLPQAEIASRLDELPRDRPIITVCQVGARSRRAAQFLLQMGFERVASTTGGTEGWINAGKPIEGEHGAAAPRVVETEWAHAGAHVG